MEILGFLWQKLLYLPLLNLLLFLAKIFSGNLGLAIVALTILSRLLLWPLLRPSLQAAAKQRELKPELEALREKHKNDRQKMAQAQMELFRRHGVNPVAGCLPQLVQFAIVIALYQVFIQVLANGGGSQTLTTRFLLWDLTRPDSTLILPALAGASQFWFSKMMIPAARKGEKLAKATPEKKDDMLYNMQESMLYSLPLITVIFAWKMPSGLVLYWFLATLFSILQQWYLEKRSG